MSEEEKSEKLTREMNGLYEVYKECRNSGKYFELSACIGKVVFEQIRHKVGGVSICIYPKEEKAYDKIKRLEDENSRLRHTLLVISGNDSTSSTEMLGKIARDALYFRDTKTDDSVIKK